MADRDLTGRVLWTAVLLTPEEEGTLREGVIDKAHEVASKLIAQLPRKSSGGAS